VLRPVRAGDLDWCKGLLERRRDIPTEAQRDRDLASGWDLDSVLASETVWAKSHRQLVQLFGK